MNRIALLLIAVTLAACALQRPVGPENINLSGFPPAFQDGYADGCDSVGVSRTRDEGRFKTDPQYAQGWRDGVDICRRR